MRMYRSAAITRLFRARAGALLGIGVAAAATLFGPTGCGGGGGGGSTATPVPIAITLGQSSVTLTPSQATTLSATVTGTTNTAVTWSVVEGTSGGLITTSGIYTAPALLGTYYVTATSVADPTATATVQIVVVAATATPTPTPVPTPTPTPAVVAITLTPTTATLAVRATQAFAATVTGSANTSVGWSVQEGTTGGTISSAGLYTASSTAGTYHIVATSLVDPTKTATATVTVQSGGSNLTIH